MGNRIKSVPAAITCAFFISLLAAAGVSKLCGAQQAPAPAQSAISLPSRISPKAQELLDKAIQALGGPAFLDFKNLSTEGRVFGFANDQMAGVYPFKSIYEPPDKRRFTYGKGKPVTLINNGNEGWELDQYGLVHQLPEKIRQWKIANRYSLDNILRRIIKESGLLVLDHGVDFVANQPAYVIDIIDSQNVHIRLYLRKSNHLPLRVTYSVQNSVTQDRDEYIDDYSDYQTFQGITTPMHIARYLDGERIGELFRARASYNQTIPPDYFEPPR